jgi:hypothetical protein
VTPRPGRVDQSEVAVVALLLRGDGNESGRGSTFLHTTINCLDAYEVSEWWKRVLDYTDTPGDPNEPGDEECIVMNPRTGHRPGLLRGR